jgi:uncharacterized protein (DUF934 family)
MPRQLLRNGQVVDDEWRYLAEIEGDAAPASEAAGADLIIPFDRWLAEREHWLKYAGRLGVVLQPAHKVELLAPDTGHFDLIGAEFSGPSEGRGYTQARLLRERYKFDGELRALGYVRHDQLFFLARCGFNSFELPANELTTAASAFATFSAEYQPSNDAGLAVKLRHRG